MASTLPFEPRRFQSAAAHYLSGRPAYAPALIDRVAQLCGLQPMHRVLDLGCGPGQLAIAFSPFVAEVVGVDPEPAMLRIAAERAAAASVPNARFIEGSSYDLRPQLGSFRLVTIGRAFHWMDRRRTLERLDSMIDPEGGAVVLFADRHPELPDNAWRRVYQETLDRYAVGDTVRTQRKSPEWVPNMAVLLDSPFAELEQISVIERRSTPVERFVDRALSLSSTAPGRLGAAGADDLARDVRDVMAGYARDDGDGGGLAVVEVVASEALIARRRGDAAPS